MANQLPDLWSECFDGVAQKEMSPQSFKQMFCDGCMNAGCRNSKGAGMKWVQRIRTQVNDLVDNPVIADPNDPRYREIVSQDFRPVVEEAISLHLSAKKGDWTVPSEEEVSLEAARMVGHVPRGFQAPPRADEVQQYDLHPKEKEPVPDPVPSKVRGRWIVDGSAGARYEVKQNLDGTFSCTCPSREVPCKHARLVIGKLMNSPVVLEEEPEEKAVRPVVPPDIQGGRFKPPQGNTLMPSAGITVGAIPAATTPVDPWAPVTSPQENEVPAGGRVRFSRGKGQK